MPDDLLFSTVTKRSVADSVHDQLRRAILDGTLAAGEALPGERKLSERFGVNRHALREAIGRLAQAGLLTVSHGGATKVNDWRRTAGLDVLVDLAAAPEGRLPDLDVLRAALEMRLAIGVDVARRCAQRADAALVARLEAHVAAAREAEDRSAAYDRLWVLLVEGSGNVAYRLALNSLVAALDDVRELGYALSDGEIRDHDAHDALVAAIAAGRDDEAAARTHALLSRMLEQAERISR